jgi:glycerophosphoryl diester phosphodiesterase
MHDNFAKEKASLIRLITLAATLLFVSNGALCGVEIVGHRGASYDAPENTLPSIRLAWEREADAVEIDIHQTRDGHIVAIHDADTKRVGGVDRRVDEQTLDEIQRLDVGAWKDAKWRGTQIPTLEAVLETIPAEKTLVIEIKCPLSVLPELERVLDASGKRSQVMIIAFDYATAVAAKRRLPDVPSYWLYGFSVAERLEYGVKSNGDLIKMAREGGLDGLDVKFDGPFDKDFVGELAKLGMKLYVYTVNSADDAHRLINMGVNGITTDRPKYLRDRLDTP